MARKKCHKTGKISHASKLAADIAAKAHKSNLLNVFKCEHCGGWHCGNSRSPFRYQKRLDQIFARDSRRAKQ